MKSDIEVNCSMLFDVICAVYQIDAAHIAKNLDLDKHVIYRMRRKQKISKAMLDRLLAEYPMATPHIDLILERDVRIVDPHIDELSYQLREIRADINEIKRKLK